MRADLFTKALARPALTEHVKRVSRYPMQKVYGDIAASYVGATGTTRNKNLLTHPTAATAPSAQATVAKF
ncbi:hypothetical protein HDU86_006837 [Geranomyces michiganensis]|nr:hypothetical protein HDU86_006837 [Geranomyces michiganensis]